MGTTRGLERLIFFTDAITAIAITLLILPLVDDVSTIADSTDLGSWFAGESFRILAFMLSFAVISRLWLSHHALFEHVRAYDRPLVLLTLLWAFTIVLLPLPTAMTAAFDPGSGVVAFYIGTMTASSATLTGIAFYLHRTAPVESTENPVSVDMLFGSAAATTGFALALVLGSTIPALNYFALMVMLLLVPAGSLYRRRLSRRAAVTSSERG